MDNRKMIAITKEIHKQLSKLKKKTGLPICFQVKKALENWIEMQEKYQEQK